nr:IS5 family transposase [Desulfuromonas thiophila]
MFFSGSVRYDRWSRKGVWLRVFEAVADDPDLEHLMVDGSIVRVHHAWRCAEKTQAQQGQGQSGGGLSTKIHAAVDALGNPVRLILTQGQTLEYTVAKALICGLEAEYILTDKGHDSNDFIQAIHDNGALTVVQLRSHRRKKRYYDRNLYKERNLVELFFQRINKYRRIVTRYDRLAKNYNSMLILVSTLIWLD